MDTKPLDLRAETPESAARKLQTYLQSLAPEIGHAPDEIALWDPDHSEHQGFGRAWRVVWEGGPFEWAISLSMGGSLLGPELGRDGGEPEVLVVGARHYCAEPYFSFDLGFYAE